MNDRMANLEGALRKTLSEYGKAQPDISLAEVIGVIESMKMSLYADFSAALSETCHTGGMYQ